MKRILLMVAVLAMALPAVAGGDEYGCKAGTQECLDKMVAHLQKAGYAGLDMEPDHDTGNMMVTEVVPGSPAARAGVKAGDLINSVDGMKMAEMGEEGHHALEAKMTVGSTHEFTVLRNGKEKSFKVTLEKMPQEMIAKHLGKHMIEHATVEMASN
jgi:C-terminal processing protease CtpA/Prc